MFGSYSQEQGVSGLLPQSLVQLQGAVRRALVNSQQSVSPLLLARLPLLLLLSLVAAAAAVMSATSGRLSQLRCTTLDHHHHHPPPSRPQAFLSPSSDQQLRLNEHSLIILWSHTRLPIRGPVHTLPPPAPDHTGHTHQKEPVAPDVAAWRAPAAEQPPVLEVVVSVGRCRCCAVLPLLLLLSLLSRAVAGLGCCP